MLMSRFYTETLQKKYQEQYTPYGWTIADVIRSGVENPDSSIGVYAGGEACYVLYRELFEPIITTYHQCTLNQPFESNWQLAAPLPTLDPEGKYILSSRIRLARNFTGLPFPAAVSLQQRLEREAAVQQALERARALHGRYYSLSTMPSHIRTQLQQKHSLPKLGDRFMASAGFNRDWPLGRGTFINETADLFIWFGEEDFLRVISLEAGGNLEAVFTRLATAYTVLERLFDFAADGQFGYLTSCPSNLGTTMRAGVHVCLPQLHNHPHKLKALCERWQLQIRGTGGEHTHIEKAVYDISNQHRLGITEAEIVQQLSHGLAEIITVEKQ